MGGKKLNLNTFALSSNSHIQNMERTIVQKPAEKAFVLYPGGTGAMWTRDATYYLYEILI